MRKTEREIEDKGIIEEILKSSVICRIAFFDTEYPYVVPVNYGYKNNTIFVHCAPEGKKIELLKKNNKVCFEIEDAYKIVKDKISCNWTTKYKSLIGFAEIEIVNEFEAKKEGLDVIMNQHGKTENSYKDKMIERVTILKLNIKSISGKQSI